MTKDYVQIAYEKMWRDILRSHNGDNLLILKGNWKSKYFVGLVQIFSNETVTALIRTALMVYSVHDSFLHASVAKRQ